MGSHGDELEERQNTGRLMLPGLGVLSPPWDLTLPNHKAAGKTAAGAQTVSLQGGPLQQKALT